MKQLLSIYFMTIKTAIISQSQYRVSQLIWMIAMMVEPVVYLVVWSTVANAQGGVVNGYTAGTFAAYYITWTIVRQMNIALTPYAFEHRIRQGRLSGELMRPIHPIHSDIGYFTGWKFVTLVISLPITLALVLFFKPTFNNQWWHILAFSVVIFTGFFMRFIFLWVLGCVTFWVTKVSAVFELYFTIELLLSGRLVPMALLPSWAQNISAWLPFQWSFGFPIEVLLGKLTPMQILYGIGMQLLWGTIAAIALKLIWPHAVKQYSAVGA